MFLPLKENFPHEINLNLFIIFPFNFSFLSHSSKVFFKSTILKIRRRLFLQCIVMQTIVLSLIQQTSIFHFMIAHLGDKWKIIMFKPQECDTSECVAVVLWQPTVTFFYLRNILKSSLTSWKCSIFFNAFDENYLVFFSN